MKDLARLNPLPGCAPFFMVAAISLTLIFWATLTAPASGWLAVVAMLCLVVVSLETIRGAVLLMVDHPAPSEPPIAPKDPNRLVARRGVTVEAPRPPKELVTLGASPEKKKKRKEKT